MHIEDSTASSSTFKFAAAADIVGAESGANATIQTIDNKTVNYLTCVIQVQPIFHRCTNVYTC